MVWEGRLWSNAVSYALRREAKWADGLIESRVIALLIVVVGCHICGNCVERPQIAQGGL
jgi:hypothetical protein